MDGMPDLIGLELNEGLEFLKKNCLAYQLVENTFPGKDHMSKGAQPDLLCRIVRVRKQESGELEITYSVDTYSTGE